MADYLKIFATQADYDAYIASDYPKPNVSYIEATDTTIFTNYQDGPAGPEVRTLTGIAPEDWPSNVTTIGLGNAMASNEPLRYLIKSIVIPEGVTGFTTDGFKNLPNLEEVVFPSTMTSIPDATSSSNMFIGTNLKKVTIPPTMTSLGKYCLKSGHLSEVYISDLSAFCTMTKGVRCMFYPDLYTPVAEQATHLYLNGSEIIDLVIPDDVTYLKNYAFEDFNQMQTVVIHDGITAIGTNAFFFCKSLTSVTVLATTPPTLGTDVFNQSTSTPIDGLTIYVPASAVEDYKAASRWSTYASKIQAIPA